MCTDKEINVFGINVHYIYIAISYFKENIKFSKEAIKSNCSLSSIHKLQINFP